jgi:hypothetical protein
VKVIDVHPEELLDREPLGVLSEEQQKLLAAHLAGCEACRLERLLRADFAAEASRAGEADMQSFVLGALQRAASAEAVGATAPLTTSSAASVVPQVSEFCSRAEPRASTRRRLSASLAVACVLLIAAGAAASRSAWVARMFHVTFGEASLAPSRGAQHKVLPRTAANAPQSVAAAPAELRSEAARTAPSSVPPAVAPPAQLADEVIERPPAAVLETLAAGRAPSPTRKSAGAIENTYRPAPRTARIANVRATRTLAVAAAKTPAASSAPAELAPSLDPNASVPEPLPDPARVAQQAAATALFEQANRARRAGKLDHAATLYENLQRDFAGSPEAKLSFALSARMWLDAGNAFAAYGAFERYLATGDRALREEAMTGRALSLDRLGRKSAADAAFAELLQAYPYSSYAPLAKKRLGQD